MKIKIRSEVVKRFKVPSKSERGEYHIVEVLDDGKLVCDCPAGCFTRPCRHKRIVENYLQKINEKNIT